MKHTLRYILILIFFLFSTKVFSENFAYANLDIILKTSDVGKKIISHFTQKNEILIKDIKKKEKIIKKKEQELISQKNILQSDEYIKKVQIIKNEINVFNENNKKNIQKINLEQEKVTKTFMLEINKILRDYAELNNIDIIFSSKQMLIGKSSLDVTDFILKDVNKKIKNFEIKYE